VTLTCEICGTTFTSRQNKRFCSQTCAGKFIGQHYSGSVTQKRTFVTCAGCGVEFYRASKKVRFCSPACANRLHTAVRKLRPKVCVFCEAEFQPARRGQLFCSKRCYLDQKARSYVALGGLSEVQFRLWQGLGGADAGWQPEFWVGVFGRCNALSHLKLDLAFPSQKLAVECDGPEHKLEDKRVNDRARDGWLATQGWTVLRFSNQEIRSSFDSVVAKIRSSVTT